METYIWIMVIMLILLLLFILARLFIIKPKVKLLGKIVGLFFIVVILLMLYFLLSRPLGLFRFTDTAWSASLPEVKRESDTLKTALLFLIN